MDVGRIKVALLVPVTSRHRNDATLDATPLSTIFLPTLVKSLQTIDSIFYSFRLYIGYDEGDELYDTSKAESTLVALIKQKSDVGQGVDLHLSRFLRYADTRSKPCLVWNRLFHAAYDDGCEFFYQCGDDIEFIDAGWVTQFVRALRQGNGFGVTGPYDVRNPRILTQSFVGRSHMEIFGCYFPPEIANIFCDDWITMVYEPKHLYRSNFPRVYNTPSPSGLPDVRYDPVHISLSQLQRLVKQGKMRIRQAQNE